MAAALASPVSGTVLRVPLHVLQSYLIQNPDQQVVHVVVDPDRDLDELHPIGARHALAICNGSTRRIREGKRIFKHRVAKGACRTVENNTVGRYMVLSWVRI